MPSSSYLTHVNGLRALAIIAIILFHLEAGWCPGGYFGVDLFLVISGFFLFRKLLDKGEAERFHYGQFLMQKAWRIIPSWFVLALAVCIASWFLLYGNPGVGAFRVARSSAFFTANYQMDHAANYFQPDAQENPLMHLWYLSALIQFYILAPLLVVPLMRRRSRRFTLAVLGVLAVLSLAFWVVVQSDAFLSPLAREKALRCIGARSAYYHLLPRLWEILAGAFILVLPAMDGKPRLRGMLGLLGCCGLIASFYLYADGSPMAYLSVGSAMLAIKYAGTGLISKLLAIKPVQWLGTVSFSVYLWHWPAISFYKYFKPEPGLADYAVMTALTLALGYITWRWVETAIRAPKPQPGQGGGKFLPALRRYAILLAIPAVIIGADAAKGAFVKSKEQRVIRYFVEKGLRFPDNAALYDEAAARAVPDFPATEFKNRPVYWGDTTDAPPTYLLLGDSHAQHLLHGLDVAGAAHHRKGVNLNNNLRPLWRFLYLGADPADAKWDKAKAQQILDYLRDHPSIHYVILSMSWKKRLSAADGYDWQHMTSFNGEKRMDLVMEGLRETCRQFRALGKEVIIINETPNFGRVVPLVMWKRELTFSGTDSTKYTIPLQQHREQAEPVNSHLQSLEKDGLAHVIDISAPLFENGVCAFRRQDGQVIYCDGDHLTTLGSEIVGEYLMQQLLQLEAATSGN